MADHAQNLAEHWHKDAKTNTLTIVRKRFFGQSVNVMNGCR